MTGVLAGILLVVLLAPAPKPVQTDPEAVNVPVGPWITTTTLPSDTTELPEITEESGTIPVPPTEVAVAPQNNAVARIRPGIAAGSTRDIFVDALGFSWLDESWGGPSSVSAETAHSGTWAMKKQFDAAWDGLFLVTTVGVPFDEKQSLSLAIRTESATGGNPDLYVTLYSHDQKKIATVPLIRYLPGFDVSTTWETAVIPFTDFGSEPITLGGIAIESDRQATVLIDSVAVVSLPTQPASGVTPVQQLQPKTGQFIFLDSLVTGWVVEGGTAAYSYPYAPGHDGKTLQLQFKKEWDGLYLSNLSGISVIGSEGISGVVSGLEGNENVHLVLYGPKGEKLGSRRIQDFTAKKVIEKSVPSSFFIPLRLFGAEDAIVAGIGIEGQTIGAVHLDNLMFARTPGGNNYGAYTYNLNGDVFRNVLRSGWAVDMWNGNAQVVRDGDMDAMLARFNVSGSGLYFTNTLPMQAGVFKKIQVQFKGAALSAGDMSMVVYGPGKVRLGSIWLGQYVNKELYGEYQTVVIPLDHVLADNSEITEVHFSVTEDSTDVYFGLITFLP